ncbi:GLPGLI family protein [uncultured Flavobacterium sp.]|uniref:GLPGLI family protein n=1 Tax=uncultured Flavobacterium sp. TaxID=165435 RepID=UPI0030CA532E|tara:strand:- start:214 stop:1047 length:834 start_codon:yes stop_codon:yes gene_type:complete
MKISISLLFLSFINLCLGQKFQATAYYASQTQMKNFNITSPDMTPAMQEKLMAVMKKSFEETYVLNFTNFESLYQKEQKLEVPNTNNGSVNFKMITSGNNESKLYKNFKNKQFITNEDIFGKEFLITDSLKIFNWKLINEQKKIGNYTCYKAQIIKPVTDEDLKEYEEIKKKQELGKTSFFIMNEPKEEIIEAWYTLDIPVSNGPGKYWGLPGLILELHEGSTTLLCSKIVLNPKDTIEIKAPKNGKKVNQKKFDKIQEDKLNSMKDGDGVIQIKMN